MRPILLAAALATTFLQPLAAETLTRELAIDFNSALKSRDLSGFALREDGRLVAGPNVRELSGELPGTPWCLAAFPGEGIAADTRWLVGTGPDGILLEVAIDGSTFSSKPYADLGKGHVQSVLVLDDGAVLAVTTPGATLFLLRDGKIVSRLPLGAEAAWRLVRGDEGRVLVATGNPGRVLEVELSKFAQAGVAEASPADPEAAAKVGLTVRGEVRDKHLRSLLRTKDGRLLAGSAPKGNVYLLGAAGETPKVLAEGREGEVTDLLEREDGTIVASVTLGQQLPSGSNDAGDAILQALGMESPSGVGGMMMMPGGGPRLPNPQGEKKTASGSSFSGQGGLYDVTPGRFPTLLYTRPGVAFYDLAEVGGLIYIAAGEQGELVAWSPERQKGFTLAGTGSAQNTALAPVNAGKDGFLVLKSNFGGLSRIEMTPDAPRSVRTAALDLGGATRLGRLVLPRLRPAGTPQPSVSFQASLGSDEQEGWGEWQNGSPREGGGYDLGGVLARRVRLKIEWPEGVAPGAEIVRAFLYHLPQNQAPKLESFRILPPHIGLIRNPEPPEQPFVPLMQVLQPGMPQGQGTSTTPGGAPATAGMPGMRNQGFMSSPLVQAVGTQIVVWTVTDANGDELNYTLQARAEGAEEWTDIVVNTTDTFAQFDVSSWPDGPYTLRLTAKELTPHPDGARQLVHEDDTLLVDNKLPVVVDADTKAENGRRIVTIHGRDATSRLHYASFVFNNGHQEKVDDPVDGVLDSNDEIFRLSIPEAKVSDATSVEAIVFDAAGNGEVRRLSLK